MAGDVAIGRYLMDTLSMVPKMETAQFEKLFQSNLQVRAMATRRVKTSNSLSFSPLLPLTITVADGAGAGACISAYLPLTKTTTQDILMVVYLSNLTRAQLAIAERLQAAI